MSLVETTDPSQKEAISFEVELRHPPEKVWRALTEPALLSQWLLQVTEMQLEVGGALSLQAPPQPGWDGTVDGRFLEIEAHRCLRYSWLVGDIDTVVTFTLTPTATGTQLSIVQSGFKPDQARNFGGARYGWNLMGGRLIGLLGRLS